MNSGNVEARTRTVGGLSLEEVPASMMTQIRTDDLRALDGDTCWAIDIIPASAGTSEAPPAQLALLQRVLDGISFGKPDGAKP